MPEQFLPASLMTSDPGSFARNTIQERKPQIIRQVLADNAYPPTVVAALEDFSDEITSGTVQPLVESAEDVPDWNRELAYYVDKTWLEIPWYFAETFFYRRLLETVGYFQPRERQRRDPFEKQKAVQMAGEVRRLSPIWEQYTGLETGEHFKALPHSSL